MISEVDEARRVTAQAFIGKLALLENEKARREISSLKRNAGNKKEEARGVNWFYRLLEGDGWSAPESYFLVATLWALNPRHSEGDFGKTCHLYWLKKKSPNDAEKEKVNNAVARRFNVLLDTDPTGEELPFRLRQFVKLLASQEVGIDWVQLLLDLREWHYQDKRAQRRWARSFYAPGFTRRHETHIGQRQRRGNHKRRYKC